MINANEFKPGNYFSNILEILQVDKIISNEGNEYIIPSGFPRQRIYFNDPDLTFVVITDEILNRLGFYSNEGIFKKGVVFLYKEMGNDFYTCRVGEFVITGAKFQYLHKLQNFYNTITKEDLFFIYP